MNAIDSLIAQINTGKFEYTDLEKLAHMWDGKTCIRGAGFIGSGLAFDILICAGFQIDSFVDINKEVGTKIRQDIKVIPLEELIDKKTLFFIAVGDKYQNDVLADLSKNHLFKCVIVSSNWEQQIVKSVKEMEDEDANKRYGYLTDDRICAQRWFKERTGYELNLEHPKTFNEKLQWLKLYDRNPVYTQLVDKYAVKKYVGERIGEEYVIPTLGIWNDFDEIDFTTLPNQFVLKCTHDSGSTVICLNKNTFDYERAREKLTECLHKNYYYIGREWPYKDVKPRILCEQYIGINNNNELLDYKIMCFHGVAKCSFVCSNRGKELNVNFYDREWIAMPFWRHYHKRNMEFPKPCNYEQMISLAEKLSKGTKFVRVDFYNIEGVIYFGEMTLYPGNGMEEFHPEEWDAKLGDWIEI